MSQPVAMVEEQREWPLLRKQPQIEIGFRLFDGNSPKSRGNRDGVANKWRAFPSPIR